MFSSVFGTSKSKTFRPLRVHRGGAKNPGLQYANATLGTGNVKDAVALPRGEDLSEWLAVNTMDFYNEIALLYGTVQEFCTKETCPIMSAGAKFEYLWADGAKYKKAIRVSAPQYVELLLTWVEQQLQDETIFPLHQSSSFPKNFQTIVKNIFKRLFRVYAHIYHSHIKKVVGLGAEKHLNTCFKHFIMFSKEFKLIDESQLEPMSEVIRVLTASDR